MKGRKALEYLRLFEMGHTVTEIAIMTGRNKSTVSRGLTSARKLVCPFSPNCEECPLDDCAIKDEYAYMVNADPGRNVHEKEAL
jgi:hypothetical protein